MTWWIIGGLYVAAIVGIEVIGRLLDRHEARVARLAQAEIMRQRTDRFLRDLFQHDRDGMAIDLLILETGGCPDTYQDDLEEYA